MELKIQISNENSLSLYIIFINCILYIYKYDLSWLDNISSGSKCFNIVFQLKESGVLYIKLNGILPGPNNLSIFEKCQL